MEPKTTHHPSNSKELTRRQFLVLAISVSAGFIEVMLGWPFTSYLSRPLSRNLPGKKFLHVPGFPDLVEETPVKLGYQFIQEDAFLSENIYREVWVVKHSAAKADVFSPICTHLGCRYEWSKELNAFTCPCHGSVFSKTGQVTGGPAPRPLDALEYKIDNGELYVDWEMFKPAVAQKELLE